ncbi:hypothetical protein HD806DRAFT_114893 [Xylariaceae sp. AK1471]|nr:hypothetical protein HD806DRAFT_114893 [Xylariaceae sp. AK1471]
MSTIWKDAAAGPLVLDKAKLAQYLATNPNLINELEPQSGMSPLHIALAAGNAQTVQLLLGNKADPDQKTRDGRTPMYLAADAQRNRARMIQLLFEKNPKTFDEPGPNRNTPLMAAVLRDDQAAVQLLVERGASKEKMNSDGKTAKDLVNDSKPNAAAVRKALEVVPSKGMGGFMTYIKGWVLPVLAFFNRFTPLADIFDAAYRAYFNNANQGPLPGEDVVEPMTPEEFKKNLDNMIKRGGLEQIFPPGDPYVKEVADKAAELKNDPNNKLNSPAQIDALAKLALYQPVLYLDDSGSMWNEDNGPGTKKGDRWDSQIAIVKKIADITTRAVPNKRGCHVRFINKDTPNLDSLDAAAIDNVFNTFGRGNGWTPIGTMLRKHVLDPLIYKDLDSNKLIKRPFLVICITDGFPTQERSTQVPPPAEDANSNQDADRFRKEVRECGDKLEKAGYKRETVRFSISQIGNITDWEDKREADIFWSNLKSDNKIEDTLYITEDILDQTYNAKTDQKQLEIWFLTTLLSPLQSLLL